MKMQIMTVTPDIARSWLAMNDKNRHVRNTLVKSYASAMKRGEWRLTHQPVAIDDAGQLLDGQHRLMAVLLSGVSVEMLVCFDAERETIDCIDVGAKRSLGDILSMDGDKASTLRFITNIVFTDRPPSMQQAERVLPFISTAMSALFEACPTKRRRITQAPTASAAVIRLTTGVDRHYVLDLWRNLALMNLSDLPPIANSFLKQVLDSTSHARTTKNQVFARAWEMFDPSQEATKRLTVSNSEDAILEARGAMYAAMNIKITPLGVAGKKRVA
jgi:hypothetical protein